MTLRISGGAVQIGSALRCAGYGTPIDDFGLEMVPAAQA